MFRIKRHFAQTAAAALSTYLIAAAVPPTITVAVAAPMYFNYQGRLKKDGAAVNDFRHFRFRLTDETGASEYYTSGSTRIYVTNGLFNYKAGPLGGVNFASNPLYMEVSVGESSPDNLLLPREALVSSPYAIYAASAAYSMESGTATYAQNSAALATRAFSAFVSTRAENQTIAGVKTFTGNVGIGTAVPGQKLEVAGQGLFYTPAAIDGAARTVLQLEDNTATAEGVGAGISLYGALSSGRANLAGVKAHKENSVGTNTAGALALLTTPNGGSPTERMRISSVGKVGIGGLPDPDYLLRVAGPHAIVGLGIMRTTTNLISDALGGSGNRAVYSDPSGILTNSSSDIRLKKDIETLSDCLNNVIRLRGVKYNWDASVDRSKKLGGQREIGMIAQEVEKVLPEIVGANSDGYKSLDYPKLTAVLVEAIKEQQIQINALRRDIENLKK